jgi:hypothetical protein
MLHPSDPSVYQVIEIHTARCTVCNERNLDDRMRRCPRCMWQICGPCREQKKDDLRHGINLISTGKAKRKPLPQLTGRTPKRTMTPLAFDDVKPAPAAKKAAPNTTPESSFKQKLKEVAQETTPPSSGVKRRRPTKPVTYLEASDASDLSDPPEDDEFLPEPASPSLGLSSRKRQKTTASSRTKTNTTGGSPVKRARLAHQKKSVGSESGISSSLKGLDVAGDGVQGMQPSQNKEAVAAYTGIDVNAYQQHPLARSQPMSNRTVKIPLAVQRWNKPRKSAAEIQSGIQEKVGQKLEQRFGWPPRPGVASASVSTM